MDDPIDNKPPTFWQMLHSVMAAAFGVQSGKNRARDFTHGKPSHFVLLGILAGSEMGYAASMFYIITYAIIAMGAFGIVILLSRNGYEADQLNDLKGLSTRHPWYAFMMMLFLFSMLII